MRFLWIMLFVLLTGCTPAATHCPDTIILSRELSGGAAPWHGEIARHTHRPVTVIVCHGGEQAGVWVLCPDDRNLQMPVRQFVAAVRATLPGRDLFLVICNPAGDPLRLPGVYYATRSVWMLPGQDRRTWLFGTADNAGRFEDFRQDR